jgi:hypothetical protein
MYFSVHHLLFVNTNYDNKFRKNDWATFRPFDYRVYVRVCSEEYI